MKNESTHILLDKSSFDRISIFISIIISFSLEIRLNKVNPHFIYYLKNSLFYFLFLKKVYDLINEQKCLNSIICYNLGYIIKIFIKKIHFKSLLFNIVLPRLFYSVIEKNQLTVY